MKDYWGQPVKDNNKRNRILAIGLVLAVISVIAGSLYMVLRPTPISEFIEESPTFDKDTEAFVRNGDELYQTIDGSTRYDIFIRDLRSFAVTTMEAYSSQSFPTVVFQIDSDLRVEGDTVSFEGRFARSNDTIIVTIKKLQNLRMDLSITNEAADVSIDEFLEANNQLNRYIAGLPEKTEDYEATYTVFSNKVIVAFNRREAALLPQTKEVLSKRFTDGSYDADRFVFTFPNMSVAP